MLLVALGFLGWAGARAPKHIPRFAFDTEESPVNVPLMLRVMLVNMGPEAEPPPFRIGKLRIFAGHILPFRVYPKARRLVVQGGVWVG